MDHLKNITASFLMAIVCVQKGIDMFHVVAMFQVKETPIAFAFLGFTYKNKYITHYIHIQYIYTHRKTTFLCNFLHK